MIGIAPFLHPACQFFGRARSCLPLTNGGVHEILLRHCWTEIASTWDRGAVTPGSKCLAVYRTSREPPLCSITAQLSRIGPQRRGLLATPRRLTASSVERPGAIADNASPIIDEISGVAQSKPLDLEPASRGFLERTADGEMPAGVSRSDRRLVQGLDGGRRCAPNSRSACGPAASCGRRSATPLRRAATSVRRW